MYIGKPVAVSQVVPTVDAVWTAYLCLSHLRRVVGWRMTVHVGSSISLIYWPVGENKYKILIRF